MNNIFIALYSPSTYDRSTINCDRENINPIIGRFGKAEEDSKVQWRPELTPFSCFVPPNPYD
jgi:hypothetical protein